MQAEEQAKQGVWVGVGGSYGKNTQTFQVLSERRHSFKHLACPYGFQHSFPHGLSGEPSRELLFGRMHVCFGGSEEPQLCSCPLGKPEFTLLALQLDGCRDQISKGTTCRDIVGPLA